MVLKFLYYYILVTCPYFATGLGDRNMIKFPSMPGFHDALCFEVFLECFFKGKEWFFRGRKFFFLEGRKEDDEVVKRYGYTYMRKILELHLCTNVSSFFSPGISSFFCKMYQLEVKSIYRCGKETIYEVAKKISNTL